MGRGLVEPVDDIRVTNPASHPELLEWLAEDFVAHGYRIKHTIALICNSAAYSRSASTLPENEADTKYYSHALTRPLEAEVIADMIGDVTGIPLSIGGSDQRAVQLTDNRLDAPSLDILGRCDRSESCTTAANASVSLARSLHLINGPLINQRLANPKGRLRAILEDQSDNQKVLEELYLLTLSRPDDARRRYWTGKLSNAELSDPIARREFFEDVLWGLLTSEAFITNH